MSPTNEVVEQRSSDQYSQRSDATPGSSGTVSAGVAFDEIAPMMRLADMMAPMAVRVAATLRLADHISRGVATADELAETCEVDTDSLRRLLRFLIARDVFAEDESGRCRLTEMSKLLLSEHPALLRERFDLHGPVGRGDLSFVHLLDSISTGTESFSTMYGKPFWDDLNESRDQVERFAAMMAANSADSHIESEYDWSSVGHVVDVGGGNGTLISQVLHAHPHIRGTVVDLPSTADKARQALHEKDLAERCDVVAASFFDRLPNGGDVYVLCKILHDWGDAEALAILRRCAEAAGPRGRVLISEMVPSGDPNDPRFTYLDLHMLVYFGGKERTLDEYARLAGRAGMTATRVGSGKWGASLLECRPIG